MKTVEPLKEADFKAATGALSDTQREHIRKGGHGLEFWRDAVNPNPWVDYQPHRQRDKEIFDIELRDGTVVKGCYPNGVHWNAIWTEKFGLPPRKAGRGPWPDYRVVRIRRSWPDPFAE